MSKGYSRIIVAVLFFATSFLLEIKQKIAFGWSFDLALVAILVLPLFLDFAEFLFFGSLAFLFLKSAYPWSGPETILLIAFPVLAFLFQKLFPWQSWLEPFILIILGLFGFYGLTNPSKFFGDIPFLFLDIFVSMIYGWIIYYLFAAFAGRRT